MFFFKRKLGRNVLVGQGILWLAKQLDKTNGKTTVLLRPRRKMGPLGKAEPFEKKREKSELSLGPHGLSVLRIPFGPSDCANG